MWLESTFGQRVPGRCRSTNLCDYCAKLAAVENAEVLAQDALTNAPPLVWTVTTTRSSVASMSAYRVARRAVTRAVLRRWPDAERATLIEFTTGLGRNAGGVRRPHWNDLWKRIPADDLAELRQVVAQAWCGRDDPRAARVDAELDGQFAGTIEEVGGLMRYLALHFQKSSQQPPEGWDSHRFTVTRGYLATPMPAAREAARDALRLRRELHRAERLVVIDADGEEGLLGDLMDPAELWDYAQGRHDENGELGWTLVRETNIPTSFGADGQPASWSTEYVPV